MLEPSSTTPTNENGYLTDNHWTALANKYPYFAAAQFFTLKAANKNSAEYPALAAKAGLHFIDISRLLLNLQNEPVADVSEREVSEKLNRAEDIIVDLPVVKQSQSRIELPKKEEIPDGISNTNSEEISSGNLRNKEQIEQSGNLENQTVLVPPGEGMVSEQVDEESEILESLQIERSEEPLFEPLHTSDYFASQGIKLSEEVQPQDKLGKQLKSFTQWLQTMKKVHDGVDTIPVSNEIQVQQQAEQSNKSDGVVTEAMAEAYRLQGKVRKSVEVYEKLKLLNPDKSGYFAAKISEIDDISSAL